jgi:hypothetical protein
MTKGNNMPAFKLDVTLFSETRAPFGVYAEFSADENVYLTAHTLAWRLAAENSAEIIEFWVTDENGDVF